MVFGDIRESVDEVNIPRFFFLPISYMTLGLNKARTILLTQNNLSKQSIIMNKTLQLLSLQVSKHLRCFRLFLLTLLLCGFMQTMAETWTDDNGLTWSFTINGTEATDIRFRGGPDSEKIYLYGDPNNSEEQPFVPGAWDAAAMRFSYTEGRYLPTIPDDVYFGLKTLIFDVSDVTDNFDLKVMNGWWSNTYYDHVKWQDGLNELPITEIMANECAKGGEAKDLDLMLYSGSMTFNAVYYESSTVSGAVIIPAKVYVGSTELTVTSIGNAAFSGCAGLTSVTIPEGVTRIGNNAFSSCAGLTSVTIPSSVTSIGNYAFYNCYSLTNVTIPEGVTSIGDATFRGCSSLTNVNIPSSVTSIGDSAFSGCFSLTSVNIPSSVTYIGDGAFLNCGGLTSITVDSGNTIYDSRDNCNAIIATATNTLIVGSNTTVIPNSVTVIGYSAFRNCTGLTSIEIPNSVTSIGTCAFYNCSGLTSITIPNSVTSIGGSAFHYTGWYANQSDGILYLDNWLLGYKGNEPTGELTIFEGTKGIAASSFYFCTGLTSVIIPNSVMSIGDDAFYWCSGLTSVTIGNSVTSIGDWAFSRCPGLTSVTIPSSVTSIGDFAFYECNGLTTVTSLIEEPFDITENVFMCYDDASWYAYFTTATLYVPAGTKSLYEATPTWNQFQNIVEMDIEPMEDGETVDFGCDIDENTDLDGSVVGDILYSISSGDGSYDPAEGCIVVTTPTDDSVIDGQDIFGEDFQAGYTGIVFKVAEGKGTVKIEAQTTGTMVLKVKIGNNGPVTMVLEGKQKVSLPYSVTEPTYVYIYGGSKTAQTVGMRHAPADGVLKIYSIEVESVSDGIVTVQVDEDDDAPVYNLNGQRVNTPRKGIYIKNGKKVLVK